MSIRDADELLRLQREQDALRRAEDARRILNDPSIQEAWKAIDDLTIGQLADTPLDGSQVRNEYALELVRVLQANRRQRRLFEIYVQTGQLVDLQIEQRASIDPVRAGGIKH